MKFDAIIFDLDGVICFTDEYHYKAWKSLADEMNIPFDRSDKDAWSFARLGSSARG